MKTKRYLTTAAILLTSSLSAFATNNDKIPGATVQDAAFFTGKPYDADLESYVFNYRNYSAEAGRWTTTDPSGFPDGANDRSYSPVPTNEIDFLGLRKVTLNGSLKTGDVLSLSGNLGTVTISKFDKIDQETVGGVNIDADTSITADTGTIYRWRQTFSITDQDGHFLDWHGTPAKNLVDGHIPYYWDNLQHLTHAAAPNGGEKFWDSPTKAWDRLNQNVTSVTQTFTTQLVRVSNLNQATGGTVVLTFGYGFTLTE